MSAPAMSDTEIREKGFAILRRELSRGEFVRFLQSLYQRPGNYTSERPRGGANETVDALISAIHAGRQS